MKKKNIYIIFLILLVILLSSCGRKITPSAINIKSGKNFDTAAFDYVFVEAVKQKLMGNGGDALRYFEQCLKINPQSDAVYYQMALIVTSGGDTRNGKKYASKALSLVDKNIWYLMMLGGIYYQEKNLDSAIIYYEKAVEYFPEKENLQLTLGNLYSENNNYDKAREIFDSFDSRYGVNETSTLAAIKSLVASKKYDEALTKINLLLKEYPDEILYNGLLAEIYRGKGDNDNALLVYNKLIERNPYNPQTQLSFCDFLISEKNFKELFTFLNTVMLNDKIRVEDKISLMSRLIEMPELVNEDNESLLLSLLVLEAAYKKDNIVPLLRPELLTKAGRLHEAAELLEDAIKVNRQNYYGWEKLLLVYMQLKDYEKLMTRGEECATLFNRSFLAKILYANGALENSKYDVALEELRKAEILAEDNKDYIIQVLTMRADVYYRMKDYTKAFELFEAALKTNKDDLTVLNNYAYYLAEQNMKLKEAEIMAKSVIDREKGNTTYLDTYGWILYKRGKLNDAAKVMVDVLNSGEKPDAVWYEHYGYILKKQKNCTKAIENWEIALKLDSTKTDLNREIENCRK